MGNVLVKKVCRMCLKEVKEGLKSCIRDSMIVGCDIKCDWCEVIVPNGYEIFLFYKKTK